MSPNKLQKIVGNQSLPNMKMDPIWKLNSVIEMFLCRIWLTGHHGFYLVRDLYLVLYIICV